MTVIGGVPDAGDIVWVDLGQPVGHAQGGRRPAIVLTSREYNANSSVLVVCPISRSDRGWPFKVALPQGETVSGFVLIDQIKTIDPAVSIVKSSGRVSTETLSEVRGRLASLLGIPVEA